MNVRLLAGIGSRAFSLAASAAPSADVIELAFTDAAASRGYPRVVELLLTRGANVNAEAKGRTALKAARENEEHRLINASAEELPAMQEARGNRGAIIHLLEEHGATK